MNRIDSARVDRGGSDLPEAIVAPIAVDGELGT